ncbi:LysR family transcriptional regulator [Alteromonas sp. KUL17]|uniref:LysR family transcriptional regulator n=1 Tax=Alteromonas sp. KUL17 TaxID=2480796 RepID=UPI0010376AFD|nr:LysR family transcriptional regulator [Alteromonas sp. KUL17]TAP25358.1 LysR family transcriptional regulator [Alteromonas sp. KUL17]GEA03635.1 LysR family transcriptional regulator [Alteromonas sp. KUL17]
MDKLQTIKVFIEVAKQQSFSAAAEVLGISAPVATRAVAELEGRLRVKLFNRTTRLVRLTESGTRFFNDTQRILEDLDEAESHAAGVYATPSGTLTLTAPVMFGQKHIMPIVNEYLGMYEEVGVKAMFFDRLGSLLEEELDVAIRIGHLKDSSLYAVQVGSVRRIICGAPSYFKRKGIPKYPQDLLEHDLIFSNTVDSGSTWHFQNQGHKESVKLSPRLMCNQNAAAVSTALKGFGITRLMSYQVGEEIEKGTLQSVLTGYEEEPLPVHIIHVEGRRANAKVRAFIDLAVERLRENPYINSQTK